MAVLKLCDQVGARGRGRGGRAAERRGACTAAGHSSRAVPALGRRKGAFAAGEGRQGAGVAAVRGGRGPPHRGRGRWRAPGAGGPRGQEGKVDAVGEDRSPGSRLRCGGLSSSVG